MNFEIVVFISWFSKRKKVIFFYLNLNVHKQGCQFSNKQRIQKIIVKMVTFKLWRRFGNYYKVGMLLKLWNIIFLESGWLY